MSGELFVAPGAREVPSRTRRALDIAGDLALAVALIWSLPLAVGIVAALVRLAVSAVR